MRAEMGEGQMQRRLAEENEQNAQKSRKRIPDHDRPFVVTIQSCLSARLMSSIPGSTGPEPPTIARRFIITALPCQCLCLLIPNCFDGKDLPLYRRPEGVEKGN